MTIETTEKAALAAIAAAMDEPALDDVRVRVLGKKGEITALLRSLGTMSPAERPAAGARINAAKNHLQAAIDQRRQALASEQLKRDLAEQAVDVSLPGRGRPAGSLHPITQTLRRIEHIFATAGYGVESGPEIEDDYHNFEALNIPRPPSGAGDARHALSRQRHAAAHAYVAGASTSDGAHGAADPHHLPRSRVPQG